MQVIDRYGQLCCRLWRRCQRQNLSPRGLAVLDKTIAAAVAIVSLVATAALSSCE
jgi:hypothetical protein